MQKRYSHNVGPTSQTLVQHCANSVSNLKMRSCPQQVNSWGWGCAPPPALVHPYTCQSNCPGGWPLHRVWPGHLTPQITHYVRYLNDCILRDKCSCIDVSIAATITNHGAGCYPATGHGWDKGFSQRFIVTQKNDRMEVNAYLTFGQVNRFWNVKNSCPPALLGSFPLYVLTSFKKFRPGIAIDFIVGHFKKELR